MGVLLKNFSVKNYFKVLFNHRDSPLRLFRNSLKKMQTNISYPIYPTCPNWNLYLIHKAWKMQLWCTNLALATL